MTNEMTPPSSGGMPKWLIILLVALLVIILGCCGGIGTCVYFARPAVRQAKESDAFKQVQQEIQETQTRVQQSAGQPSAGFPPAVPSSVPAAATGDATPTPPPTDAAPSAANYPKTFPTDIPILAGMTPSVSSSDNITGNGMVMLSGKVKTDDVVTYYTQAMEKAGYTQTNNTVINNITQLVYTKNESQVFIQVTPGDNAGATSTNVMISFGKKK